MSGQWWPGGPVELPATISIGGEKYRVRPISDRDALAALGTGQWTRFVPEALTGRDRVRIAQRLYDPTDGLDLPHLFTAGAGIAARLAGLAPDDGEPVTATWWPATRIAGTVMSAWMTFDGWCMRRGFDPAAAPLRRVIAAGWQFMIDFRDTEDGTPDGKQISVQALRDKTWAQPTPTGRRRLRFTASQERSAALAALRESLPG